jgi:uncharacterized membrane protein HdeD (DUF308 family)
MKHAFSTIRNDIKYWYFFGLGGVILLVNGFMMMFFPIRTFAGLSLFFGLIIFTSGIGKIIFSFLNKTHSYNKRWIFTMGIFDIIIAVILIVILRFSVSVVPFLLGCWVLVNIVSLLDYITGLHIFNESGWVWMLVGGIFVFICALLLIISPILGMVTVILWNAIAFSVSGIYFIVLSLRLRRMRREELSL